jgi:hypothetical protein
LFPAGGDAPGSVLLGSLLLPQRTSRHYHTLFFL